MLRKGQSYGYIGKAELSKNHKKTKVPFFATFLLKSLHGALKNVIPQASMLSFFKKSWKKRYFCFFYGALFSVTKSIFQLQRPKMTIKYLWRAISIIVPHYLGYIKNINNFKMTKLSIVSMKKHIWKKLVIFLSTLR